MNTLVKQEMPANIPALSPGDGNGTMPPAVADLVFVLALPRSFSSVVGAMLGQHPGMYALPETHLFSCETIAGWWRAAEEQKFPRTHGLLRAVAELFFGGQTQHTVRLAKGWLRRRSHFTTGLMMEALTARVHPRTIVDKSPSVVYSVEYMNRAYRLFPQARFLWLLRHPRGQCESVMSCLTKAQERSGPNLPWVMHLATYPNLTDTNPAAERSPELDPQKGWFVLNQNIHTFFNSLPDWQRLRVRGEDLLQSPDEWLRHIAAWMGLATDDASIDEMKHPERSCYACFGPPGARLGQDHHFMKDPVLRPARAEAKSLEGPLSWRQDGEGFFTEVKELAREFGYE